MSKGFVTNVPLELIVSMQLGMVWRDLVYEKGVWGSFCLWSNLGNRILTMAFVRDRLWMRRYCFRLVVRSGGISFG